MSGQSLAHAYARVAGTETQENRHFQGTERRARNARTHAHACEGIQGGQQHG
jgi:hypothetical protein